MKKALTESHSCMVFYARWQVEGRLRRDFEDLTAVVQELRRQLADADDVAEKRQKEGEKKQREDHVAVMEKLKAQHEKIVLELNQSSEVAIKKLKMRCEQLQ
jgi:Sec-independent protein translocase protein TatA